MRLTLDYGSDGLEVELPDDTVVVEGKEPPVLPDEDAAVRWALAHPHSGMPLADLVRPGTAVAVAFPDLTRPMPNPTVLPPLLDELARLGAGPDRVELLCATGTHRPATGKEMAALVGPEVMAGYRVHDHQATDPDHVRVGAVDGIPVLLDRRWVDADIRITTGFVEPHFFAGWSGGPKGVCPGLAATATILEAHSPDRIADTLGVTAGLLGSLGREANSRLGARLISAAPGRPRGHAATPQDSRRRTGGIFS